MIKNKHGKIELEILIFVIIILVVSGIIFGLIRAGILNVRPGMEQVSVLNAEFIPFTREGTLAINTFQFCGFVDEQYGCFDPRSTFGFGEAIRFTFVVESSPYNGLIKLVENYRVTAPSGKTVLEAEDTSNFNYELKSSKPTEKVSFKDYFTI
ncbi:MAG: hypothetical protein AABX04_04015, partial [Nanoarchaeota archaeon]